MALGNCDLIQIYYNDATKLNCEPGLIHAFNPILTPFFENTVIAQLGTDEALQNQYVGVLSHNFFIKNMIMPYAIANEVGEGKFDVYAFSGGLKIKNVCDIADTYHPGFKHAMFLILDAIGFDVDINEDTRMVCYQNAFIAKTHIFEHYVRELLLPAMKVMNDRNNERIYNIIWNDSGYYKKKDLQIQSRLRQYLGVNYYPYHPFICERLFSLYMQKYKHLTFKHLC